MTYPSTDPSTYLLRQILTVTNLNVLLLDIVSIIMQWASVNMLYQKRYKTDIFNKSAFVNRKLIVIYLLFIFSVVYLSLTLDSPLDNHLVLKA